MKSKIKKYVALLAILLMPFAVQAAPVGFTEESVWLSKEELVEGDTVTIYALVVNGESLSLSANVNFYDRTTILGTKSVKIGPNDALIAKLDWKVTAGEHEIRAALSNASLFDGTGAKSAVTPTESETSKETVFVKKSIAKTDQGKAEPAQTDDKNAAALDAGMVTEKVKNAGEFIENNVPAPVMKVYTSVTSSFEGLRETWEDALLEGKMEQKEKIGSVAGEEEKISTEEIEKGEFETQNYINEQTESGMKKPFAYIFLILYSIGHFIVSHALIFYAIAFVLVYKIIRAIWHRFKSK